MKMGTECSVSRRFDAPSGCILSTVLQVGVLSGCVRCILWWEGYVWTSPGYRTAFWVTISLWSIRWVRCTGRAHGMQRIIFDNVSAWRNPEIFSIGKDSRLVIRHAWSVAWDWSLWGVIWDRPVTVHCLLFHSSGPSDFSLPVARVVLSRCTVDKTSWDWCTPRNVLLYSCSGPDRQSLH